MQKFSQISIETEKRLAPLLSDFLLGMGSLGVAEDIKKDDLFEVTAYFPIDDDLNELIEKLRNFIKFLEYSYNNASLSEIKVQHIDKSHWMVWRNLLTTVKATNNVYIKPPWEQIEVKDDQYIIEINPSLAFGTGHHETTQLCIRAIEKLCSESTLNSSLDVGCGSGILSICTAKFGMKICIGLDIDLNAVKQSYNNSKVNKTVANTMFYCGHLHSVNEKFDLVLANISVEAILSLKFELKSRMTERGYLVISGIPHIRTNEVVEGLSSIDLMIKEIIRDGDWIMAILYKSNLKD